MLVFTGCAQKQGAETESVQTQQEQSAQAQAGQQKTAAEQEQEEESEEVEEYGVSEEKAEEEGAATEQGLRDKAKQTLKERIHFAFDSSELSKQAQDLLKSKAKILKKNPGLKIVIEGHCDERGTDEYNMALGERRARAAYEYLILLGVDADRMNLVSYGEERPLVQGDDEQAWAKNRRDEFKIKR
ncbi:MAG: peptidoglycan-associated lipoprotein Pal [Desulfohalobiaceae bacterium]|nr:peptidoglycan-associated lipoprotein Pal [Desulfohalobiaceae bacterium]